MRMQVILDSSFARLGSAFIWGGKKGELRDWTSPTEVTDRDQKGKIHQFCEALLNAAHGVSLYFYTL